MYYAVENRRSVKSPEVDVLGVKFWAGIPSPNGFLF
jgi:hypothetical protein